MAMSGQFQRVTVSGDDVRPVRDDVVLKIDSGPQLIRELNRTVRAKAAMMGIVSDEWTRHLGYFLEDLFITSQHLGK